MTAPIVERHFAAVRITTSSRTYHLNRERLQAAIRFLTYGSYHMSAAERLTAEFPGIAPRDTYSYLCAAQVCIDHNIQP